MSKYKLIKKWHPSQVEEVGHVFESESLWLYYKIKVSVSGNYKEGSIAPHEIALLVDAEYLQKEEIKFNDNSFSISAEPTWETGKDTQTPGGADSIIYKPGEFKLCNGYIEPINPTLDLWTTEPPKGTTYYIVNDCGIVLVAVWQRDKGDEFRLRTNNCHRTQKSAEEALKRLLEK